MGESPGANRCGASALGIETSVFRHAAVHRMEHGPVPRACGFDDAAKYPEGYSRRRLHVGHARRFGFISRRGSSMVTLSTKTGAGGYGDELNSKRTTFGTKPSFRNASCAL
jgi:hypothetical protein